MISRAEARIKIKEITDAKKPIKTGLTLPIRKGATFDVYRIPLNLLVPNILNDRITWKIREYEAESGRNLDIESDDDVQYLSASPLNNALSRVALRFPSIMIPSFVITPSTC